MSLGILQTWISKVVDHFSGTPDMIMLFHLEYCLSLSHFRTDFWSSLFRSFTTIVSSLRVFSGVLDALAVTLMFSCVCQRWTWLPQKICLSVYLVYLEPETGKLKFCPVVSHQLTHLGHIAYIW